MDNLKNSWKNKSVAKKQLQLNINQISDKRAYPNHWNIFLNIVDVIAPKKILDVGCGCGVYYKLLNDNYPGVEYVGVDYSPFMVRIAKQTWNYENFFLMDYKDLTQDYISQFDTIHLGALLDVLSNGDEALDFILSLRPKNVIIGRVKLTESDSFTTIYKAYNEIETYAYNHNVKKFTDICTNRKFSYIEFSDNFLLTQLE